jgi:CRP/FNR family transcriptional regulator
VEDSVCLLLPREPFTLALRQNHELCLELLGSFAQWVRHFVSLVEDIALRDAIGRVARYLAQHADPATGQVRLSPLKKHVASHLNLTAETLSRTLRRLTDEGVITSADGRTIVVEDPQRLTAAAEGGFPRT